MKNNTVLITTLDGDTLELLKPITNVRTIIPIISSTIAALRIVVPTSPFNLPNSLKVYTVILTDVAVKITPINNAS